LRAAQHRRQQPFRPARDEDNVRGRWRFLERLQQGVLPGRVQQFGFIDDEDLRVAFDGRAVGGRVVSLVVVRSPAEHVLAQKVERDADEFAPREFAHGRVQREFLANQVEVRVRLRGDHAPDPARRIGADQAGEIGARVGVEQQAGEFDRRRAFSDARRPSEDPRVLHAPAAKSGLQRLDSGDLSDDRVHARDRVSQFGALIGLRRSGGL